MSVDVLVLADAQPSYQPVVSVDCENKACRGNVIVLLFMSVIAEQPVVIQLHSLSAEHPEINSCDLIPFCRATYCTCQVICQQTCGMLTQRVLYM
jgi:hypothetical protein